MERILPPPDPARVAVSARPDGWSALKPLKPDTALAAATEPTGKGDEDKANSSLRREPELPDHVEIVHEKKEPEPENEFRHLLGDDQEDIVRQRQAMRRQMRGLARQVSMDPNDTIDM
jgi:type IV secretion system protein VirD4